MSPARKPSKSRSAASKTSAKRSVKSAGTGASKSSRKKPPARAAASTGRSRAGAKGTRAASSSGRKTASKATGKKTPARKTTARSAGKSPAKKTATKKNPAGARAGMGGKSAAPRSSSKKAAARPSARRAPAARAARPAALDAQTLASIREQLTAELANYERQMAELEEETFLGSQTDLTGDMGLDDDFADAGSATFDREQALSIQNNIRDLMDQATRAIARIDEGTYGTCERCGKPIASARLKARPRTLLCMDCKRREERAR